MYRPIKRKTKKKGYIHDTVSIFNLKKSTYKVQFKSFKLVMYIMPQSIKEVWKV